MLVGRETERAAIAALLDAARSSRGGSLVVRGGAGAGKSALLADSVAAASDMTVLSTSGVESESPLAFAALARLLWPLRRRTAELPTPQRAALRAALGEAEGEGDRFLAFLGTLSLLADTADEAPILAVVDDAQWLDDASAAGLLFVARRLQAERVALLFAARDEPAHGSAAPDLPSLELGGVVGRDADRLLAPRDGGAVDPAVRDELVAATGGNPLALVELADVLTAEQLAARAPLPVPLPLTGGVERRFLDRCRRLSPEAQQVLLIAAADDTARPAVVRAAGERLGIGEESLDESERAGLVRVEGDVLTLYHPLVRSAVYRAATSAQRRAVHRALADVLGDDPDRRAWHLAAAADRPDPQVVTALDTVGERAAARGGHEAAAAAWARAAELTAGRQDRGDRLLRAASSAWLGAHPSRAMGLVIAAAADVTDPLTRARLLTLQGQIEWNTRSLNEGYDLVLQATEAAAAVDEVMARQLAMLAAALSAFGAGSPRPIDPAALVTPPPSDSSAQTHAAWDLMHGFTASGRRRWAVAAESFRRAFARTDAEPIDDHVMQPNLGIAAWLIDDDERSLRLHDQQLTAARRAGALSMVEHALTRGFHSQVATGAWAHAAGAAAEALPLAASTGHPGLTALPTAQLALIEALRGNDATERRLDEVTAIRAAHPVGITDSLVVDLTHWARALRTTGKPGTALHHLARMQNPALRRMAAFDAFDIAARAGRPDDLRTWFEDVEGFAAATGIASAVAAAEHGRALLAAGGPDAEKHFLAALEAHVDSLRVPDRARTHLAYGEYLRRARRRVDARDHLRTALTLFEELGAAPSAERAAQELRASGETARRRDVATATELTAQERQVAALVRQGLSNRDVAARLFVSARTVDFHLRNTFTKLGVSSRAELTALALD